MSDLDFRILADSKELDNLLTDISSLKTSLVNLEDVNRAINTSFKAVNTSVDSVSTALTSASASAKQLHADLGYVIGDLDKIKFAGGFDPLFGGSAANVKVGNPLGQAFPDLRHPGNRVSGGLNWLNVDEQQREARRRIADTPFTGENITIDQLNRRDRPETSWRDIEALRDNIGGGLGGRGGRGPGGRSQTAHDLGEIQTQGRKATLAIVELSRGAEDAAVTFGTGGLAGALRASINNFSQFAFIIHPMAGAVAGIAGALTAVFIPALLESGKEANKLAESIRDLSISMRELQELRRADVSVDSYLSGDSASAARRVAELERQIEDQKKYDIAGFGQGAFTGVGQERTSAALAKYAGGLGASLFPGGSEAMAKIGQLTSSLSAGLTDFEVQQIQKILEEQGSAPGSSAARVRDFLTDNRGEDGTMPSRGLLGIDINDEVLQRFVEIEKEYKTSLAKLERANEDLAKAREEAIKTEREASEFQSQITETELMDKEDARKERDRDRMISLISGLVDQGDPEARMRRELREQLQTINNIHPENSFANVDMQVAARSSFNVRSGLTKRQKEIDEQIESLEGRDPLNSLAGKLTGLTELNRRITESAAGIKDPTVEQLKGLREERKKAAEEAKKELEKINEKLAAQLNEREQREVGLLGP